MPKDCQAISLFTTRKPHEPVRLLLFAPEPVDFAYAIARLVAVNLPP